MVNESKSHTIGPSHCFFGSSGNCCLTKLPERFHNLGTIYHAPVVFSFSAQLHRLKPRSGGVRIHTYSDPQGEDRNFWAWFATMALLMQSDWWNKRPRGLNGHPIIKDSSLTFVRRAHICLSQPQQRKYYSLCEWHRKAAL